VYSSVASTSGGDRDSRGRRSSSGSEICLSYYGEHEIVRANAGLWFEQSYTGSTRSRQGTSFLSQVKSHPGCHRQKATRPMSQTHGEVTYKLTSPYCKWVWALRRIGCRPAGAHRPQTSDLTSKKTFPDGSPTCEQYGAPRSISSLQLRMAFSKPLLVPCPKNTLH